MNYRRTLFWDTKPENIDKTKNKRYIIERVLEFGDDKEVRMIFQEYDKKDIFSVANNSRSLSPQTKALWTKVSK
jgi:hypothetical protein